MPMEVFRAWPPTLTAAQLEFLTTEAVDWALAHGLILRPPTGLQADSSPKSGAAIHAPFSLFPSPVPRQAFERAVRLQPLFQQLIHAVSLDRQLMESIFVPLSKADDFTGRLYDIYLKTRDLPQVATLGVHRSDYMLHGESDTSLILQQVEFNTIAASFASLSTLVTRLHQHLAKRTQFFNAVDETTPDIVPQSLPENISIDGIAEALAAAWKVYGKESAVVVMAVQPGERNISDQRWIEYNLLERFGVKMLRKTLAEIHASARVDPQTRTLTIDGEEVAVVYYRAGYGPSDYPTEAEWAARLIVEQSRSIKCPNIAYQLVGAKKVQQVLAAPGAIEKYVTDQEEAKLLRSSFAGIYPLDDAACEQARKCPDNFVLKPQREGGGNNFYGANVALKLASMSAEEKSAFILMDRIRPPPFNNVLVRQGNHVQAQVISELGIYGYYLTTDRIVNNKAIGHLLRTKMESTDEGGVATGYSVIDSPFLC